MNLNSAYSKAKSRIKAECKSEIQEASLKAHKRMNIRLRSLDRAFEVEHPGGAYKASRGGPRSLGLKDKVVAFLGAMTPGSQFSIQDIFGRYKANEPGVIYGSFACQVARLGKEGKVIVFTGKKVGGAYIFEKLA